MGDIGFNCKDCNSQAPILRLDVQTYFLNGFLLEEIHMEQPVGFVELGVNIKSVFSSDPYIA